MTIDEEWEHGGVVYWLRAEVHIPSVEVWTGDLHSRWATYEPGKPEILDLVVFSWDAASQGFETPAEEPRLLEAARAYVKEYTW